MPFQVYCPQGHLLEVHESQMGQHSQCPLCQTVFVVPVVQSAGQENWAPGYQQPSFPGGFPQQGFQQPGYPQQDPGGFAGGGGFEQPAGPVFPQMEPEAPAFPNFQTDSEAPAGNDPNAPATPPEEAKPAAPPEPEFLKIPCPQGHELETPLDMLGQEVLCPVCNSQFLLRREDSLEFKAARAEAQKKREERINQAALKWSIIAAVVVALGIIGMLVYHFTQPRKDEDSAWAPARLGPMIASADVD